MTKNETQADFMRRELDKRFSENIELREKIAKAIEALRPFAEGYEYELIDPDNKAYRRAAEVYKELVNG